MENPNIIQYISVVVPVYNEEGCLQELIDRTIRALDSTGKKYEFILVDDGSRDASAEIMRKAAEAKPDQVIACILNRASEPAGHLVPPHRLQDREPRRPESHRR